MIGRFKSEYIYTLIQDLENNRKKSQIASAPCLILLGQYLGAVIEAVEIICSLINISADLVRSELPVSLFDRGAETGKIKHKGFLGGIRRGKKLTVCREALCTCLLEDRLYTYDRIENIRAGIALESCKFLFVEYIVLGSLVGQIPVLDG